MNIVLFSILTQTNLTFTLKAVGTMVKILKVLKILKTQILSKLWRGIYLQVVAKKRKIGQKNRQIEAETNSKRKRGCPKGVKNNVKVEEDWTPEKKFKTEHIESIPMIEIKDLENEILSKSLRNKELLFLAESVDEIEDQTNLADVFCEDSEEVDDFDVHDFLLDDKSYSNIDFFFI